MPPASPVPGWSSGEVCRLIIARRSIARSVIAEFNFTPPGRVHLTQPGASLWHSRTLDADVRQRLSGRVLRRAASAVARPRSRDRPSASRETPAIRMATTASMTTGSPAGCSTSTTDQTSRGKAMPTIACSQTAPLLTRVVPKPTRATNSSTRPDQYSASTIPPSLPPRSSSIRATQHGTAEQPRDTGESTQVHGTPTVRRPVDQQVSLPPLPQHTSPPCRIWAWTTHALPS